MATRYNYLLTANYRCGHHQQIEFSARYRDEAKANCAALIRVDCPDCQKRRRDAEMEIKRASDDMGLPPLKGSVKQVPWANRIRIKVARKVLRADPNGLEILRRITNAKFWIEARDFDTQKILQSAKTALTN